MSLGTHMRRLKRTSWSERLLLAEAVGALGVAAFAIRIVPFRSLAGAAGSVGQGREGKADDADRTVERICWAIRAAAPKLPWKNACFQEGLALHSMLRRRGINSFLHYGVGQSPEHGLTAHVWVSVDGRIVVGEKEAARHACLATFPATAERQ